MSSAKWWTLQNFIAWFRSFIYNKNRRSPRKQNETEQERTGLKILTPKKLLQRLPIAFAQVKVGNNSESLLNEIR